MGVLLSGSGIAVPSGSDLSDIIHERRAKIMNDGSSGLGGLGLGIGMSMGMNANNNNRDRENSITARGTVNNSKQADKRSLLGHIREYMGGRSKGYVVNEAGPVAKPGMAEIFTPELKAELVKMQPGSVFGLEQHIVKNITMGLDSIVVSVIYSLLLLCEVLSLFDSFTDTRSSISRLSRTRCCQITLSIR